MKMKVDIPWYEEAKSALDQILYNVENKSLLSLKRKK
tara:strand:- start:703 stop:813 length:111 start_codon:yes stop_codon:yes gene_type:complete